MATTDFGQWLWSRGTRQHERIITIMRFVTITDVAGPRRGIHGIILIEPCDVAPDGKFMVTVRTTQTAAQAKRHVEGQANECPVVGFLSPTVERGDDGVSYRPIIGRVGLTRAERRDLERRAAASAKEQEGNPARERELANILD